MRVSGLGGSAARRLGRMGWGRGCALSPFLYPRSLVAQDSTRPRAFTPTTERTLYPLRQLAPGVYAVLGDSGKGAEGRPNAGFVVTREGVVAVGGLASPAQARAVIRTIRTKTRQPLRLLVLYAHHPDMMFGAIEFKRAGAGIVAHPDTRVLAAEAGPDQMLADWEQVVGLQELLGFEYANTPDRPVTQQRHPAPGREAGRRAPSGPGALGWGPHDLAAAERVLFAGDILLEDGVTMVVDGHSGVLLKTLDLIDSLGPTVVVPGHGRIAADPTDSDPAHPRLHHRPAGFDAGRSEAGHRRCAGRSGRARRRTNAAR